jgi:preprotein translocase subunit SecD
MTTKLLSLAAVLLLSGYSGSSQSSPASGASQFQIGAADVAKMSMKLIKGDPSIPTQGEYHVQLGLSTARATNFQKFTQLHLNQKVQIVLGTNVVAEPIIRSEITNGKIVLHCPAGEIKKITEAFPKK